MTMGSSLQNNDQEQERIATPRIRRSLSISRKAAGRWGSLLMTALTLSSLSTASKKFSVQAFTTPAVLSGRYQKSPPSLILKVQSTPSTDWTDNVEDQGRRGQRSRYSPQSRHNNNNNNNSRRSPNSNNRGYSVNLNNKRRRNNHNHRRSNIKVLSPEETQARIQRASDVEQRLGRALTNVRSAITQYQEGATTTTTNNKQNVVSFPSIRDCNSALATMGDTGDFKRALHLFGKMRKAARLVSLYNSLSDADVANDDNNNNNHHDEATKNNNPTHSVRTRMYLYPPAPTLVTYSTLMSRAVSLRKERVALRLWRLMTLQKEFYTNLPTTPTHGNDGGTINNNKNNAKNQGILGAPIIPDIRAVNILMNAFAKLGDNQSAALLMEQLYRGQDHMDILMTTADAQDSPTPKFLSELQQGDAAISNDLIKVVPKMDPNIVTFNTMIDACHRAGDLDAGLEALQYMKSHTDLQPDARTYTSLISTVARRPTKSSGASDPDLAFSLFQEMVDVMKIRPNGMTYCALIDVCGRCRRSDLALKGLRMMLRQKAQDVRGQHIRQPWGRQTPLYNEVGAWTAAINACGRAGRLDTAVRLFDTMTNYGTKPNTITCGCLTDCLLKNNNITETLRVLRYMKDEGIQPTEVMYTSLMTSASRLAKMENERKGELILPDFGDRQSDNAPSADDTEGSTQALEVYTELILSLVSPTTSTHNRGKFEQQSTRQQPRSSSSSSQETSNNTHLLKVFLVFQEMKLSGADPDLACYNALLRACADVGDVARINSVLRRIEDDGFHPNKNTWREILRGAANSKQSNATAKFWDMALTYRAKNNHDRHPYKPWIPNVDAFDALISSYLRHASVTEDEEAKARLYLKALVAYNDAARRKEERGFHHIDMDLVKGNQRIMMMIVDSAVSLDSFLSSYRPVTKGWPKRVRVRNIASELAVLDCLQERLPHSLFIPRNIQALKTAKDWSRPKDYPGP